MRVRAVDLARLRLKGQRVDVDSPRPLVFRNAGYFFIGILIVALLGFTPSYFPGATGRPIEFSFYTHFHATVMTLWLALLIAQPFLIKHGRLELHRRLGKVSYVLLPLVMIAAVLLMHHRLPAEPETPIGVRFFIPFKDLIIIGPAYVLAMVYRRNPAWHARLMVGSTFQLIEPGLVRALINFLPFSNPLHAALLTWGTIDAMLVYLVVRDRHLKSGKWIFRSVLAMTLAVQLFLVAGGPTLPFFTRFAEWFAALSLT